ncbi:MAG: hypothetical protein EZS28_053568 [Streblomastix strix]|uniref:Uncharacterized protein n=1 Tax=Streblomastix strix TaxID=222440 RepID=A0A5J4R862_9EUKA|nr:MAG: hypothetical protein EZS28_053568 [Streblomastix strix]
MYGFGILATFWMINAILLLVAGIEGIIYSASAGDHKWFKITVLINSAFAGIFLFGSILMMNPMGIFLRLKPEAPPDPEQPILDPVILQILQNSNESLFQGLINIQTDELQNQSIVNLQTDELQNQSIVNLQTDELQNQSIVNLQTDELLI